MLGGGGRRLGSREGTGWALGGAQAGFWGAQAGPGGRRLGSAEHRLVLGGHRLALGGRGSCRPSALPMAVPLSSAHTRGPGITTRHSKFPSAASSLGGGGFETPPCKKRKRNRFCGRLRAFPSLAQHNVAGPAPLTGTGGVQTPHGARSIAEQLPQHSWKSPGSPSGRELGNSHGPSPPNHWATQPLQRGSLSGERAGKEETGLESLPFISSTTLSKLLHVVSWCPP